MSNVYLSCLPWFIQRDIIDRVIAVNRNYCLVNREWLQSASRQYGKLQFGRRLKSSSRSSTSFVNYFEVVEFNRIDQIPWPEVYNNTNIRKIIVSGPSSCTDADFTDFLLRILNINSLVISEVHDNVDLSRILKFYSNRLKTLSIYKVYSDCSTFIRGMVFPNLVTLKLSSFSRSFCFESLSYRMPNLKKLYLNINSNDTSSFPPHGIEVTGISELGLNLNQVSNNTIKLDLSRFKGAKRIYLVGKFKLINRRPCLDIEELKIINCSDKISEILLPTFCNLNKLCINLSNRNEAETAEFSKIMELCPNLICLYLTVQHFNHSFKLPAGSFSATILRLEGSLPISAYLDWALINFSLKRLELDIHTSLPTELRYSSSETLDHVIIRTENETLIDWYKIRFGTNFCPHLQLLEFIPNSDCCHFSKGFM